MAGVAGGSDKPKQSSKTCRDFLEAVLAVCHRIVMTREIASEWKRHAGAFARKWLIQMYGRRKVKQIAVSAIPELDEKVCKGIKPQDRLQIQKDMHLLHATLKTDGRIVSLDKKFRAALYGAGRRVPQLKCVTWVNPNNESEHPIDWLKEGAPPKPIVQ